MDKHDSSQWQADVGSGYSRMRPLDEGGMGTLYRAHKDSLDVDVVIKRVKRKFRGRIDQRAEANILKNLKHRYLPRIYDIITSSSGYIYTVMDYIQGENMQKYVEQHGPADQKTLYRWACQLCEATAYLHSQNPSILHCDIKPSNVMITPEGDICMIDFNTSLVFSDGVLALGATPGYAAPEQYSKPMEPASEEQETGLLEKTLPLYGGQYAAQTSDSCGQNPGGADSGAYSVTAAQATGAGIYGTISKSTDVYGIGATLYYAATGQNPAHSLKRVRPIASYKCKLSKSFLSIITRAMRKRQEERFRDAQEMLRALLDIHVIDRRYKQVVQGQRVVAVVSAMLGVLGAVLIVLGTQRIGQERRTEYDLLVRIGRTAGEKMQFEAAEEDLLQAVSLFDDRLEAYVELAVLSYRQGEYQECVDRVGSVLTRPLLYEKEQSVSSLYYTAARSYEALGEYGNAVQMYEKAIERTPLQAAYYQGLVSAQLELGDLSGAQTTLERLAETIPEAKSTPSYQIAYGMVCYRRGEAENALAAAYEVIESGGESEELVQAYLLAARILAEQEDGAAEEIALLKNGIQEVPQMYYNTLGEPLAEAYVRRAEEQGGSSDLAEALEIYQNIQKNGNRTSEIRLSMAVVQYRLKQFKDAGNTLLELLEDFPDDYRIYKWLAFVEDAGQIESGKRDFDQAQEYLDSAERLYAAAQASGAYDPEMEELRRLAREWQ